MDSVSLALISIGMLGCLRSGASWYAGLLNSRIDLSVETSVFCEDATKTAMYDTYVLYIIVLVTICDTCYVVSFVSSSSRRSVYHRDCHHL